MMQRIKDFSLTLSEEIKYHESVEAHKKNLETTLWGLEEQARFPENSSNMDQDEIVSNINTCQLKISSCIKLLDEHEKKIEKLIKEFNQTEECSSCLECK